MKFKILEKSYFDSFNTMFEEGALIGDGTPYQLPDSFIPGHHMEPLDDEAKAALAKVPKANLDLGLAMQMEPKDSSKSLAKEIVSAIREGQQQPHQQGQRR